jgi:hypothetical protein
LNELRKAKGLKPFKYDARLEAVAQSFVIEKNTTPWDEKKAHFDRYGHGPSYRLNKFGLLPPRDIFVEYGENVVETNHGWVSVFDMLSVLAGSPPHARWMFSPRITNVGFGYFHKSFLLIQEFLEVNKKFVSKIPETSDMKFLEKSLWEKACKTNDTLDYNFYLIYFPEGTHSKEVIPVKHDDND